MWSVLKKSPVRSALTLAYLLALLFVVFAFIPASAESDGPVSGHLNIPSAGLSEDVTESWLEKGEFYVPNEIVGAYRRGRKIFLMGHSHTAFRNLPAAELGDPIFYQGRTYRIVAKTYRKVEDINMLAVLRDTPTETLVLMTCAGENYSERLIITAE